MSPTAFDSSAARPEHSAVRFLDRLLATDEEPLAGAHIISPRRGYLHHGIYVGDARVVHYAGWSYGFSHGPVEEVSLAQFARGRGIWTRWRPPAFDRAEIVRRARSRVGEDRYRILQNNCEHFCEWCVHGESRSYQVERLLPSRRPLAIIMRLIARWEVCSARVLAVNDVLSRKLAPLVDDRREICASHQQSWCERADGGVDTVVPEDYPNTIHVQLSEVHEVKYEKA